MNSKIPISENQSMIPNIDNPFVGRIKIKDYGNKVVISFMDTEIFFRGWVMFFFSLCWWALIIYVIRFINLENILDIYSLTIAFIVASLIGIVMLINAFKHIFKRTSICINGDIIVLKKASACDKRELPIGKIKCIERSILYQDRNHNSLYGIRINTEDSILRFGSTLSESQQSWLASYLNEILLNRVK